MLTRSPAELMRAYGLHAKKAWGQNFLHDRNVVANIVAAAALTSDDCVVEIGAGLGALTGVLAEAAGRVVAVERDRDLAAVLRDEFADHPRVEVVEANALTFELSSVAPRVHVVGNLPYNISSPLLFHLLEQREHLARATLMLQRELADRLVAAPGNRTYGGPSVIVQHQARVETCLHVKRGSFTPQPKVASSVIQLVPKPDVDTPPGFAALVRAAFNQRRKVLPRALSKHVPRERLLAALAALGVEPTVRAEALSPQTFAELAHHLAGDGAVAAAADGAGDEADSREATPDQP